MLWTRGAARAGSLSALLVERGACCLHVTLLLTSLLHGAASAVIRQLPVENGQSTVPFGNRLPMFQETLDLCPSGMGALECFEGLLTLYVRQRPVDAQLRDAPKKRTDDSNWRLCPPNMSRLECFDRYVAMMIRTGKKKKRSFIAHAYGGQHKKRFPLSITDENYVQKRPRLNWRLCPNSQNKLGCFENYMAWWLHMVDDDKPEETLESDKEPEEVTWDEQPEDRPKRGWPIITSHLPNAWAQKRKKVNGYFLEQSPGGAKQDCMLDKDPLSCIVRRLTGLANADNLLDI